MAKFNKNNKPNLKLILGGKTDNYIKLQKIFNLTILVAVLVLYFIVLIGR